MAHPSTLVSFIKSLQHNPWQNWETGTEIIRQITEEHHIKKDLSGRSTAVFQIVEKDQRVQRLQNIQGTLKRQEFMIKDESGIKAASKPLPGTQAALFIGGKLIETLLCTFEEPHVNGERIIKDTINQWVSKEDPQIILRYLSPAENWSISAIDKQRVIKQNAVACVELKLRKKISIDEYVETIQYLSPQVPGHVVEEFKAFYKNSPDQKQPLLQYTSHEKTTQVSLPEKHRHQKVTS